ncbi:MAG: hypothetical protein Kow0059_16610 [Candidatus Sumerlaeia bacterium]
MGFFGSAARTVEDAGVATAPAPAGSTGRVAEIVLDIQRQVSRVRGLAIKAPLESRLMTHDELLRFALQELSRQYGERFDTLDFFLRAWGLIPLETPPLRDLYLIALREQVGGLYDPHSRTLYILQGFDPDSAVGRIILAHEICHALQDQHFNLAEAIERRFSNEDALLAFQAVVEGDATLLMTEYSLETGNSLDLRSILSLLQTTQGQFYVMPYYLQQMFVQPYLTGSAFLTELTFSGTMPRNAPLQSPPLSTEQILHPEKYTAPLRDDPTSVTLPDRPRLSAAGWTRPLNNTMGELQIKLLMDAWHGLARGARLAEGWDGDAYSFWHKDNEFFSEWRSVWDSPGEAAEFYDGLLNLMQRRSASTLACAAWGDPAPPNPATDAWAGQQHAAQAKNMKNETSGDGAARLLFDLGCFDPAPGDAPHNAAAVQDAARVEGANWRFLIARAGDRVHAALFTLDAEKLITGKK